MPQPTVSVVMPAFNSERYVLQAIQSVQAQTSQDWELLVVDGGSRDQTRAIVSRLAADDPRVRLLPNPNDMGPAHARCTGVLAARGEYVAFLDADDLWLREKLDLQISVMRKHGIRFSYGRFRNMSEDGARNGCLIPVRRSFSFWQMLRHRGIGTLTVVVERALLTPDVISVWRRAGGEECMWWLLMLRKGLVAHLFDRDIGRYRDTGGSLSKNVMFTLRSVWQMYRDNLQLPLYTALPSYACYLVSTALRKARVQLCVRVRGYR